jgi:putative salt-induced outer membrane protein YdiY
MSKKKKKVAVLPAFAILLLVLGAPVAIADEIVLANGDRLTGKIVRKESDTLVLNTSYAGDLNIKWSEIRRITTDTPIKVYFQDGGKLIGTLHSEEDGSVIITTGETPASAPVPMANLRFINPSAEVSGEGAKVTGHINAGLSATSGNTQTTKIYLDTEGIVRTRDDRYTLGARGAHTRDRGVETESSWLGHMKYDRFLTKKWYGYANGDFENDRFRDIRLRTTLGLGSGYQIFESDRTNLSLEGGLTYVHTDFIVGEDDAYPAARWALKFDHMLLCTKIQFFHAHEAFVGLDNNDKMFVRSQTGFRIPLMDRLNATAQYNVDWDNTPANGRVRTDKTLLLTLGYTW